MGMYICYGCDMLRDSDDGAYEVAGKPFELFCENCNAEAEEAKENGMG